MLDVLGGGVDEGVPGDELVDDGVEVLDTNPPIPICWVSHHPPTPNKPKVASNETIKTGASLRFVIVQLEQSNARNLIYSGMQIN